MLGLVMAALSVVAKPCAKADAQMRCGNVGDLNVVVVRATNAKAKAIPMFHLEGGPGIAATNAAAFYATAGGMYRQDRDVVLVDQRGSRGSSPWHCPALEKRGPSRMERASRRRT